MIKESAHRPLESSGTVAGLLKRKESLIIPFKEAKKQKLIRITEWQYQTEPMKTTRKMEITAMEWMNNYADKMNQDCGRGFVIVEHKKKNHVYAVFAKPCEDK